MTAAHGGQALAADAADRWHIGSAGRDWSWIGVIAAAVALGKTLQPPNTWAATQAQVDYRFGLVKRGLFGAVFTRTLHLQQYERFALFSFLLLAMLLASVVLFTARSGLAHRLASFEVLALIGSSYSLTYLAHTNGYLDIPLALILTLLLLVRNPSRRLACGVPAVAVALLLHEAFLVLFLPVLLFSFLVQPDGAEKVLSRAGLWRASLLGAIAVAITGALAMRPSLTPSQTALLQQQITQSVDFTPNPVFFSVMTASAGDNLRQMMEYLHKPGWWKLQLMALLVIGPTVALLLTLAVRILRAAHPVTSPWLRVALFAAALSPLLLHLVGFDTGRWNSLLILNSFLLLLSICYYTRGPVVTLSPQFRRAIVLGAMLNMASGSMLLTHGTIRTFPFLPESHISPGSLLPRNWRPDSRLVTLVLQGSSTDAT